MDKILINGMRFYGYHGVLPEENRLGQRFMADVVLYLDLQPAGQSDHLAQTVNYAEVYEVVQKVMEGTPAKLLEALAESVAQALFTAFDHVHSLTIKIIKPDPPIPGHYDHVAVEITRERSS
ncbi:dihydroneopterin aldolase [Bacillaceae bacterium SIJ1]|uniref:dihydroneopterin aldolase n=1 Tax=Litoribacterium kuwaitense TaxID=1398745 RepID=UPI0013EC804E|nr:dihydroneopterin aldolase [Litoribacterium kuwaitense]NGP46882.1 dihydroneopterin aldolase [Litoribacterium kuwaitense]